MAPTTDLRDRDDAAMRGHSLFRRTIKRQSRPESNTVWKTKGFESNSTASAETATSDERIGVLERVRTHVIKLVPSTITPYEAPTTIATTVKRYGRGQQFDSHHGKFDTIVDFEATIRDPDNLLDLGIFNGKRAKKHRQF